MEEKEDPVEQTMEYQQILPELELKIMKQLAVDGLPTYPKYTGWIQLYWRAKKNILRTEYGIEWKSPAEMNPHIIFD